MFNLHEQFFITLVYLLRVVGGQMLALRSVLHSTVNCEPDHSKDYRPPVPPARNDPNMVKSGRRAGKHA